MQDETTQKDKNTNALYKPKSSHEAVFMSMSKKAEKISTAIYMVTDLIEAGDPIRHRLRECGVELIRETRQMSFAFSGDIYFQVGRAISKSWEIISLIDVASSVGFISDMNARILRGVLIELVGSLRDKQKRESFSKIEDMKIGESLADQITLSKSLFDIKDTKEDVLYKGQESVKLSSKIKDKEVFLKSPVQDKAPAKKFQLPKEMIEGTPIETQIEEKNGQTYSHENFKEFVQKPKAKVSERKDKIIEIVKEKGEVMIGDITSHFPDVSSKTIQRELASLVESGTLRKEGEKRWSRYSIQ